MNTNLPIQLDTTVPGLGLLFCIGIVVSLVNSISGGGSILSLPILIFLGLPSAIANGTNRIGVLMGSLGSLIGFRAHGKFLPRITWQVGWPAALGAIVGSLFAVKLPDRIFNPILAVVILFVVFMTLRGHGVKTALEGEPLMQTGLLAFCTYAAIGFYGGFIQAGSGLIMIFAFSRMSNLDIFRINALKVSNTILFISVSLITFWVAGKINWPMALALGLGNFMGGWLGSHWQIHKGAEWINRFLLFTGLAIALKLIWDTYLAWTAV
jgi:uncharacterized protein